MNYQENHSSELKEILVDEVKEEIIAFLNSDGGTLYLGVKNDGTVVGIPKDQQDEVDLKIGNWVNDALYPPCKFLIQCSYNSDNVFVVSISEGLQKPYYLKDKGPRPSGCFIRVGSSKRHMTEWEIISQIRDYQEYSFERGTSPNQELTFHQMLLLAETKKVSWDEAKYKTLGIRNWKGEYTNLGLLLSDQNPSEVKFAVYDKDMNFKVKKTYQGSLALTAMTLVDYVEQNYNTLSAKIVPGQASRVERESFPGASLREAIINAFCHADYSLPSNIKIEFFPQGAKITSPGGLYKTTMAAILCGIQTFRNPALVKVFDKLGMIENYGSGIQRILKAYPKEQP
ncbi:MAG: putative DNA binding domain-containing protein [Bacilli bacterium]|jgi:ATP-dependent DNA helicase RecG|nr:putative DNA binding domain-containing protein [Bacilli bacterium]